MSKQKICDWHKADVVAALHKAGTSLRKMSRENGYENPNALHIALHRPWPRAEQIIAARIGVAAHEIWPSRYDAKGKPNRRVGRPKKVTHGEINSISTEGGAKTRVAA